MSQKEKPYRPLAHFAPPYGWMNDPNGLVYHDGVFELCYQHNPNGVEWGDLAWGHARGTDLVHWEDLKPTLFPDEDGWMYSGCGIVNRLENSIIPKGALVYYYTAAALPQLNLKTDWFTIRLAYSTDGGNTFIKTGDPVLESLGQDNRDPKVFWHEATKAYILVLWIEGFDFGIYRSTDLFHFELANRITLPGGFECPDLFELPVEGTDEKKWVFWSASGEYFVGDFDGYNFTPVQNRLPAYLGFPPMAYAAQTWSGLGERVVSVAWLRTKCVQNKSTSVFSLPREFSLVKGNVFGKDCYVLRQFLPQEIAEKLTVSPDGSLPETSVPFVTVENDGEFRLEFVNGEEVLLAVEYHPHSGNLCFTEGDVTTLQSFGQDLNKSVIIYDRGVLEVTTAEETRLFTTDFPALRSKDCTGVRLVSGKATAVVNVLKM